MARPSRDQGSPGAGLRAPGRRRRRRRTWPQRLLIGFNILLIMACLATAAGLWYAFGKLGELQRVELGHGVLTPEEGGSGEPQNFLLVGSDSRAGIDPNDPNAAAFGDEGDVAGQRSDTIMVLRLDPDAPHQLLLSFPRDLWVRLANTGNRSKINAAYTEGPQVLTQTIQQNFGIPIHHYVEVDFVGFKSLVDAIDGVPVPFETAVRDRNTGLNIPIDAPGCVTLNGDQALAYARSRAYEYFDGRRWRSDPTGDLGRITRQQDFIKRALKRAVSRGIRNPLVLNDLLNVAIDNVRVDDALTTRDILSLGNRLRTLDPEQLVTYSVPADGARASDGASILVVREAEAEPIFDLFRGTPVEPEEPLPPPPADLEPSAVTVRVLNGSGVSGAAGDTSEALVAAGFRSGGVGNVEGGQRLARTVVRYAPGHEGEAALVASYLNPAPRLEESAGTAAVVVVLGTDFIEVTSAPAGTPETTVAPTDTTLPTSTTVIGVAPPPVEC